jgi:hypothetical protein
MLRSNRNFPDDPTPPWQERDPSPMRGPATTDGGSLPPSPAVDKQPDPEIDGP